MRTAFFIVSAFILFPFYTEAQKISVKNDTAYVDNSPYCIIRESDSWAPDYSLLTLKGEEFLFARYTRTDISAGLTYYELTFLPSGRKSEISTEWNFGRKLVREAYRNNMIVKGKFNPASEDRFMKVYGSMKPCK